MAREYGEALEQLAMAAEAAGAWSEALGWWARAVEHDPVNSHLVLQQVRVLAAMGDRANAIRVAEAHARRLREEFDLEPDREILSTIERIRRGELSVKPGAVSTSQEGSVTLSEAKGAVPEHGPLRSAQGDMVGRAAVESPSVPPQPKRLSRWVP